MGPGRYTEWTYLMLSYKHDNDCLVFRLAMHSPVVPS